MIPLRTRRDPTHDPKPRAPLYLWSLRAATKRRWLNRNVLLRRSTRRTRRPLPYLPPEDRPATRTEARPLRAAQAHRRSFRPPLTSWLHDWSRARGLAAPQGPARGGPDRLWLHPCR